jgi:hypothetical protein
MQEHVSDTWTHVGAHGRSRTIEDARKNLSRDGHGRNIVFD